MLACGVHRDAGCLCLAQRARGHAYTTLGCSSNSPTLPAHAQTHFDVSVWAWEKLADKKWGVIGEAARGA